MNYNMKNFKLLVMLCGLLLFFSSCNDKVEESEWNNYYGYTNEDVIGTYTFSNIDGVFNDVEGLGRHACPDAEITIIPYFESSVEFRVNCPSDNFSRAFQGQPIHNDNDFMLHMTSGYIPSGNKYKAYNVTAYVMKNDRQQLRLHGYAAVNTYHVEGEGGAAVYVVDDGVYYYFDVIKD